MNFIDNRHWLDKQRYAYPLFIAIGVLLFYLLTGCSTNPPRDILVAWDTPPCSDKPQTRRVGFIDTMAPTLACAQASTGIDTARIVVLALVGMPVVACAVTTYYKNGHEYTIIYAPITTNITQVASAIVALNTPNAILEHEIEHAFGKEHSGECRKPKEVT